MTQPDRTDGAETAVRPLTVWDRVAIGLLGTAGFALSYDALQQVATAIHTRGSLTFLFPIVVDGFIAYGVRALVLLRGQQLAARLYAWMLFAAATCASIWANALHAIKLNDGRSTGPGKLELGDLVVGALSMLAPLALAGAVHLYILMARTADGTVADRSAKSRASLDRLTEDMADATEPANPIDTKAARPPALTGTDAHRGPSGPLPAPAPAPVAEDDLLPLAREAVSAAGRTSRTVVASALRSRGHRIGNERLGDLLARLREEDEAHASTATG